MLLMIQQLVLLMLVPISIGMVVRRLHTGLAERYRAMLKRASFAVIAVIILFIIANQRELFATHLASAAAVATLLVVSGMAIGSTLGRIIGAPPPDRLAFLIEFSSRNTAIAIVVAASILGRLDYALFVVAYFIVELAMVLGVLGVMRVAPAVRDEQ